MKRSDYGSCSLRTVATIISLVTISQVAQAEAVTFGSGANQFSIEFAHIGNAGNEPDTTGNPDLVGSVAYEYKIGKYEISRDIITKANAAGGLQITLEDMSFVSGGARPNMPATRVTWNESARFVNWLNTSQGFAPAYKFATQPGDPDYVTSQHILLWTSDDAGFDASNPFRNRLAHYFLPDVHEWYKAAFYDPSLNEGAGGYWNFPTGGVPIPVAGGTEPGTAVFRQPVSNGPADVDNAGGLSAYGVMGQGGNIFEWQETEWDMVNDNPAAFRFLRGGIWGDQSQFLSASNAGFFPPFNKTFQTGFRVAAVPEPNARLLMSLAAGTLACFRKCRTRR